MTIKLKYSDTPIEVTGMSFDEDGVFKGYFKEGDPAAPVKTDEFYPKEDCTSIEATQVWIPTEEQIAILQEARNYYGDSWYDRKLAILDNIIQGLKSLRGLCPAPKNIPSREEELREAMLTFDDIIKRLSK